MMSKVKKWYEHPGQEQDVVVSTHIYLSRNLEGFPFVRRMRSAEQREAMETVLSAVENSRLPLAGLFSFWPFREMDKTSAVSFVERGLATPEYIARREERGILLTQDESLSMVLNGEDHLQIHVSRPGLDLESAYDSADRLERLLSKELSFSYDETFGYLTQNPADLGTGMHASLLLHLPALEGNGAVPRVSSSLSRLGIDLRESMEAQGKASVYRLTNRVSLGISEQEALFNLKSMALQVITQERSARKALCRQIEAEDRAFRSRALLGSARLLSQNECMELLSNVRLGVSQGFYSAPGYEVIARWMAEVQPATLSLTAEQQEGVTLDQLRAAYVRRLMEQEVGNT